MRYPTFFQLAALASLTAFGAPAFAKDTHKPAAVAVTAPVAVQAANTEVAGSVRLTWQPVKGATEYVVASSRETTTSWQSVAVTSTASYDFVDLPEGTKYYFRVACNTKAGQGPWSAPVMLTTTISKGAVAALQRPLTLSANTQTASR
jgi:hypothetical protein